ncbi:leucyl aminopeptidase family protein [Adhaeribacter aquaticus]|uniref:leucyl aminopeptidase family protein n=1 Tax=Adhaeribacter aquaticus TaxID=299567 RepID=UPI0004180B20|nr:leucyl aminopeptidase [Adhaeribacter aquaticus]
MATKLKYDTRLNKNKDTAIIIAPDFKVPTDEFSSEETSYIEQQLQNKSKTIVINRYTHRIYLVVVASKPNHNQYHEDLRKAGFALHKLLKEDKTTDIQLVDRSITKASYYLAEGLFLSNYEFTKYKSEKSSASTLQSIVITDQTVSEKEVTDLQEILTGVCVARNLVNEPHNNQSAEQFSESVVALGEQAGFKTEVLTMLQIQALKMGGLLAVNQGSLDPPTFNILEWKPENPKNEKPFILIGKGVVYDTGGLSLKPTPNSMDWMKSDMAGAAAVVGALYALAKNNVPLHVIGLIPATDNRPGGRAFAPGDVITMYSGKTVEVMNTDAEGRLILADALSFAKKYNPELVIDLATLTGAAARAVGKEGLVMMGNAPEDIMHNFKKAGDKVHERLVEFPLWDEYQKQLDSDIADIKNLGGADAGAITAGKFLEYFTDFNWIHLDIAGTAYIPTGDNYRGKNGTGSGVRLLYQYLTSHTN